MIRLIHAVGRRAFLGVERGFNRAFGDALNPLYYLGAISYYMFWVVVVSGFYVYIFYDTGVETTYPAVERMTHAQWFAGGIMRSLHRYASDALVVVVLVHLLREYALDRMRGRQWFAWISGVPLLGFIYICGITGYWLVWDSVALFVATATTELIEDSQSQRQRLIGRVGDIEFEVRVPAPISHGLRQHQDPTRRLRHVRARADRVSPVGLKLPR